jgi:uncharacterized protein (TIGR00255 family)
VIDSPVLRTPAVSGAPTITDYWDLSMLNSMTGFARQVADSSFGTLTCEIRTVNHRYLDIQFRLPDELRANELEFRKQVGKTIRRGKVDCSVHIRRAAESQGKINESLVTELRNRVEQLNKLLPETGPVDPMDVLKWPGVVDQPEVDARPVIEAATALLSDTLQALAEMRASEGERIDQMLNRRCDDILAIAKGVQKRLPEVMQAVRTKQQERISNLNIEADPARLETELALIAQKLDVDEELDRLQSHITEIRTVLKGQEPVGRRLDFLMQELNREANTLGSKSADAETTRAAVDLKVLIEQMREQIQNIE